MRFCAPPYSPTLRICKRFPLSITSVWPRVIEAAEARERQAEAAELQGQAIALLRCAALLGARVQLEPSELNRTRLNALLSLLAEQAFLDQQGPEP